MNADNEEARSPEPIAADLTDAAPAPEPEPKPELSRDPTLVGPVAGEDRIFYIDLLRGLALFGILAANMRGFFAPLSVYENIKVLYPGMADRIAQAFIDIFIQGKFVTLFSFLFGLGFAVQMSRAEAKGVRFLSFYPRRLLALALFGVVHGIAIWAGDILLTYSIAGAVLLLFRNRKQKTVLRWAAVFPTLFFVGITVFFIAARFRHTAPDPPKPPDMARLQHIVDVYAHGSFLEIVRQNWIGWVGFSLPAQFAVLFVIYLFLLGLWVWRLVDRGMGRLALQAISEDEEAAASVGIHVTRAKLQVTLVSALMTCTGGILYAQYQLYINPDTVSGIAISLQMVFGVIAGGMFVMLGPTVGAAFTLLLAEGLRLGFGNKYPALDTTIYGVMLVLFIIFMPKGILGALLDLLRRPRRT